MPARTFLALFLLVCTCVLAKAQAYPGLIVTEADYPALRERADREPFRSMKTWAEQRWDDEVPAGNWYILAEVLTANTLRYTLETDEDLKRQLREKVIAAINRWPENKRLLGDGAHASTVIASTAFVNTVLALDVLHDDFTADELADLEAKTAEIANFYVTDKMQNGGRIPWRLASLGSTVIYRLYQREEALILPAVEAYRKQLLDVSMYEDGSWVQSPGYWHARMGGERISKSFATDIIDHTGYYDFYNDPQMRAGMLWGNAFANAPNQTQPRFGETGQVKEYLERSLLHYRMGKYGEKAAAQAAWLLGDNNDRPSGRVATFLNYVLMDGQRAEPRMPETILFQNSGAAFWGRTDSREALNGILYNLERENFDEGGFQHSSEDVNSISLYGYGEMMLANAGTNYVPNYPGNTPDGGRWFEAWMQNVVLINDEQRHRAKDGGGLDVSYGLRDERGLDLGHGLSGGPVEFAEAFAGQQVLGRGNHERSYFFVHPVKEKADGYFLLHDQVEASRNTPVAMLLQPNTEAGSVETVRDKFEYRAPIDGFVTTASSGDEALTIFYGTPPLNVEIKQAWKGAFDEPDFKNDYLQVNYNSGASGWVRMATALIPQDGEHAGPATERLLSADYTGIKLDHGTGFVDHFISSDNAGAYESGSYRFRAESVFYREDGDRLQYFLTARGREFRAADGSVGYTADTEITIEMTGTIGQVMTDGAEVTFHGEGLRGVFLNGEGLEPVRTEAGSLTVALPAGVHQIELSTEPTATYDQMLELPGLSVFPSPFTNELNLSWDRPADALTVGLFDGTGRRLAGAHVPAGRTRHTLRLTDAELPAGTYLVVLRSGERRVSRMVVKR